MEGSKRDTVPDHDASRRRFFKMIASSPLLAAIYPAMSEEWRANVNRELAVMRPVPSHTPGLLCAECGTDLNEAALPQFPEFQSQAAGQAQPPTALEDHLKGSLIENADDAINVWDFERVAHSNNLPYHWAYLHMGVDDFETRRANREGYMRLGLRPRRLGQDAARLDTSVTIFGKKWPRPLFLCPVAALEAYHTEGESGAARAAKKHNILQIQSHQSSQSYEQIAEARGEPHWFQLYASGDLDVNKRTLQRVSKAGCPVLVWTVDLIGGSNRELQRRSLGREQYDRPLCQNCHNHQKGYQRPMYRNLEGPPGPRPPFTWDYIKLLKDASPMKVIVKGILTKEDAELCIANGADAIYVSNHGGRAENSLRGTIDYLPEVTAAVRGRVPILIDSGTRRGADIFKALALGATAVGIGRPYVWGLGAFGQDGVDKVIQMLLAEFEMVMRQTRTTAISQINAQFLMPGQNPIMMRDNNLGFGL